MHVYEPWQWLGTNPQNINDFEFLTYDSTLEHLK